MRAVLDASVAVKCAIPEKDTLAAFRLDDDFRNQVHDLLAPDTFPAEVAHALTKAERNKVLLPGEAVIRLARILSYPPILHSYLPLLSDAVELAAAHRVGSYDCLYIALGIREKCKVITADQRMINTFPTLTCHINDV